MQTDQPTKKGNRKIYKKIFFGKKYSRPPFEEGDTHDFSLGSFKENKKI